MRPEGLARTVAHGRWSTRSFCYSSQKANFIISSSPCRKLWKGGLPVAPSMRRYRVGLDPQAFLASATPLPPHLSVPATLCLFSHQESTLLLGLCSRCSLCLVHPPFSLSQVSSQLTFQAILCVISSRKPSLASLPDPILPYNFCWSSCLRCGGPMSMTLFDDCLPCHQALSSLRAGILHGLPMAIPWPLAQPTAGTWSLLDFGQSG